MSKKKPTKKPILRDRELRRAVRAYAKQWLIEEKNNQVKNYYKNIAESPEEEAKYQHGLAECIVESMKEDGFTELDWKKILDILLKILPLLLLII